jgi:outer membrane receptor for monomeric catechols
MLACLGLLLPAGAQATDAVRRAFAIPEGDAKVTLKQFAAQSREQVLYSPDDVGGVRTQAVQGELAPIEALARMLERTPLRARQDERTKAISIIAKAPSQAPPATANASQAPIREKPSTPLRPMKRSLPARLTSAVAALTAAVATAQIPPTAIDSSAPGQETVTLSPFSVTSSKDFGYTAANSLAGGRLSSPLQEMASSVSVLTREFLDDIAATDLLTASNYFPNAVPGNPASMNDYGVSLRGFPSGFLYRNFFISYVNPDSYVTERLDSARGPNALVFGDTKAGGTLNLSTKQAKFRNFGQITYRYNSEGGFGRTTGDLNLKVTDTLAVRGGLLYQDENDWRDFTYTKREGGFITATWTPFKNTTVRFETETYTQNQSSPWLGSVLRDSYGNWDGVTTYTAINQPIVAGSGTSRLGANYKVYMPGTGLNVVDWTGFAQTAGSGYQLDTYRPGYLPASTPVVPYRGYNIRLGDDSDVELDYHTYAAFVEHQVGDRLFLEVAGNFAQQQREQLQLSTEGVFWDVNRNLPNGSVNPNFGKRYTETGQFSFTTQENTLYEARASAAYVTKLGSWSDHRILVGAGYRRDQYRDYTTQVMVDVPGARFQNPFANPNSLRMRVYEDRRGIDQQLPTGVKTGLWNFFPGEDKDLYSGQFAASSKWFKDRRLVTLVGVRHDKLRKKRVTANVDAADGRFTSYNDRLPGDDFKPVMSTTAGAVYRLTSWLSPYAAYSEGYDTSNVGFLIDPATGIPNVPLPAKESTGFEFGAKFSLLEGRVTGSVGYYQNEQTNDSNTGVSFPRNEINALWNVVDNVATSLRQIPVNPSEVIDYKGTGVEFEVTANLTKNWRALLNVSFPDTERQGGFNRTIAYYTINRAEWQRTLDALVASNDARTTTFRNNLQTVDSRIASVANGLPLSGMVDYTANLFTNYEFTSGALKGLRLGGGANFRGDRYVGYQQRIANDPKSFERLETKGYALFSFSAGYRMKLFNRPVSVQLNVENVFDEQFKRYFTYNTVTTPQGNVVFNGNSYGLQAPRRFILSTDLRF